MPQPCNCQCDCDRLRAAKDRGYSLGYREGFNSHARAQQHWADTHGAYSFKPMSDFNQHGEGENP